MSNRDLLELAAAKFKERYPALTAEAMVAFFIIADYETPSIGEIAVAIGMPDTQVFHNLAPLRDAGLITVEAQSSGGSIVHLTESGQEAKQVINELF